MSIGSVIWGGLSADMKSRNFSLYGHLLAIIGIFLCIAIGIGNIFHVNVTWIIFAGICILQGLVIIFIEIPFLLKICPLTDKFTNFIRMFDGNWPRMGFYLLNAAIQYLSLLGGACSLIVVAIWFTIVLACYGLAILKNQEFAKSSLEGDAIQGQVGEQVVRNVL